MKRFFYFLLSFTLLVIMSVNAQVTPPAPQLGTPSTPSAPPMGTPSTPSSGTEINGKPRITQITVSNENPVIRSEVTFTVYVDGGKPPYTFNWTFTQGYKDTQKVKSDTTKTPTNFKSFETKVNGSATLDVSVTDVNGLSTAESKIITIQNLLPPPPPNPLPTPPADAPIGQTHCFQAESSWGVLHLTIQGDGHVTGTFGDGGTITNAYLLGHTVYGVWNQLNKFGRIELEYSPSWQSVDIYYSNGEEAPDKSAVSHTYHIPCP